MLIINSTQSSHGSNNNNNSNNNDNDRHHPLEQPGHDGDGRRRLLLPDDAGDCAGQYIA